MYYIYIYIYVMLLYMYIHISISPLWPCQATNIYEIVNFFLSGYCNSSAFFESSVFLIFIRFWRISGGAFRTQGFGTLTRFTVPDVGRTDERIILNKQISFSPYIGFCHTKSYIHKSLYML